MMDMLQREFDKRQAQHNELVSKYNEKAESKKKIEAEMIEIEKEILVNQGAMRMLDELAAQITSEDQPAEIITSTEDAEVITEA